MAYVSRKEHTIVNTRLYLPKEWTKDCTRRKEAGVPKGVKFRTRHDLALEMLDEQGSLLPHAWIAGDDEMGRSSGFRQKLQGRGERYMLAVPSNTLDGSFCLEMLEEALRSGEPGASTPTRGCSSRRRRSRVAWRGPGWR